MNEDCWLGRKIGCVLVDRAQARLEHAMIYGVGLPSPICVDSKWTTITYREPTPAEQIRTLKQEVSDLQALLREADEEAAEDVAALEEVEAENTRLAGDVVAQANKIREQVREIEGYRQRNSDLMAALARANTRQADSQRQADRGAETIKALLSEKSSKDSILDSYRASSRDLQERNARQKTIINQLVDRLDRAFFRDPEYRDITIYLPGGRYA